MDNKIDCIVRYALIDETILLVNTEDIFYRIEKEIKTDEPPNYKHYNLGFGFKKHILVAVCLLIVCTTLMFASSSQVRAFAAQAISTIKTTFTVEKVGDEYKVVEKPIDELNLKYGVARTTQKSDEELGKILGFHVSFRELLGDSFQLKDKSLIVVLRNQVDYETYSRLVCDMSNAIEDDNMLNKLKPYNAVRNVSGIYERPDSDRSTILISISQFASLAEMEIQMNKYEVLKGSEIRNVKVGVLDGYWIKGLYPEYSFIEENDIEKSDMSIQPEIIEKYILIWEKSGTLYTLNTYKDLELTLEESLKIAEEFMKAN